MAKVLLLKRVAKVWCDLVCFCEKKWLVLVVKSTYLRIQERVRVVIVHHVVVVVCDLCMMFIPWKMQQSTRVYLAVSKKMLRRLVLKRPVVLSDHNVCWLKAEGKVVVGF